jgi:outer membrane receptor protein involved in Fe transport
VGRTQRQGVELNVATRFADWSFDLRYNHIDATFRSTFIASSPNNSSADANGAIIVRPGDRIPGIPPDSVKLRIGYEPNEKTAIDANIVYASPQYALGDDNNADDHGRLPSYTVVRLDARYQLTRDLQLFMQVNNLFDRRYQTLALLGANAFTGPGGSFGPASGVDPVSEQFRAPAAPRAIWVGVRYSPATMRNE